MNPIVARLCRATALVLTVGMPLQAIGQDGYTSGMVVKKYNVPRQ
jgi:hypothetical protein